MLTSQTPDRFWHILALDIKMKLNTRFLTDLNHNCSTKENINLNANSRCQSRPVNTCLHSSSSLQYVQLSNQSVSRSLSFSLLFYSIFHNISVLLYCLNRTKAQFVYIGLPIMCFSYSIYIQHFKPCYLDDFRGFCQLPNTISQQLLDGLQSDFCANIHGLQRNNPNDFSCCVTMKMTSKVNDIQQKTIQHGNLNSCFHLVQTISYIKLSLLACSDEQTHVFFNKSIMLKLFFVFYLKLLTKHSGQHLFKYNTLLILDIYVATQQYNVACLYMRKAYFKYLFQYF